jgi:PRTRC genetic system protein C
MALEVVNLTREFSYKKNGKTIPLPDPNPQMSVEEVIKMHSSTYPELTNAMVEGPVVVNDKAVFSISTKAGQLG